MQNTNPRIMKLALLGLMLALTVTLAFFENMLPPVPGLPPGVRLGLANIVTMYAAASLGFGEAAGLMAAKSLFAALTRGATAGLLGFCGGMLSILAVILALVVSRRKISFMLLGVLGASAHNLGQLAAAALLLNTPLALVYAPVLLLFGVFAGCVTGLLLRVVSPLLKRVPMSREGEP